MKNVFITTNVQLAPVHVISASCVSGEGALQLLTCTSLKLHWSSEINLCIIYKALGHLFYCCCCFVLDEIFIPHIVSKQSPCLFESAPPAVRQQALINSIQGFFYVGVLQNPHSRTYSWHQNTLKVQICRNIKQSGSYQKLVNENQDFFRVHRD